VTIPIRNCHIDAVRAIKPSPSLIGVRVLVNGVYLENCYFFDEIDGVADAWQTNAAGRISLAPDGTIPSVRVEGRVQLVGTPEQRAWYEEHFGALL
jgi:hypothetical protein